jgi:hypothetical protein
LAALGLLPFAALTATTTLTAAASDGSGATIHASKRSVEHGGRTVIIGRFPGAPDVPVEVRSRVAGGDSFRIVKQTRTDESGRFRVRVRPDTTGAWRAELARPPRTAEDPAAEEPQPLSGEPAEGAAAPTTDDRTRAVRVKVRSRTSARLSTHDAVVGRIVRVSGRVRPGGPGRAVEVHVGRRTLRDRTNGRGRFRVSWKPRSTGSVSVRVVAGGNRVATGSRDRAGRLTVFRPARASWYGPGLYGNRTACGGRLTASTLGVAHKSMPCGTKLTLRYRNREVNVRVIDRGPYVGGREFDLTQATKNRLGFGSTGTVLSSK